MQILYYVRCWKGDLTNCVIKSHFAKHFQIIKVIWGRIKACMAPHTPHQSNILLLILSSKTLFPARVPWDCKPMFHQSWRNGFLIPGSGRGFNNSITRIINDPASHIYAATVSDPFSRSRILGHLKLGWTRYFQFR